MAPKLYRSRPLATNADAEFKAWYALTRCGMVSSCVVGERGKA